MILSFAVLLLALAVGCAVVWHYAGLGRLRPRWAAMSLGVGAGILFGLGGTSILWFLASLGVPAMRTGVLAIEIGVLAWAVIAIRRAAAGEPAPAPRRLPWNWTAAVSLAVALVVLTLVEASAWEANPQGNWDAWTVWNLRARYLAGAGEIAARAWSPLLSESHPEYPLLLSGAVARCWALGGNTAAEVPIAISYLFLIALIAAATGAVALWRGASSGLMAGVVLLCTPALAAESSSQYADVPLAAYFVCAVGFAVLEKPLWAGVMAGMAAWTKDEGAFFCGVLLVAMAIFRRRDLVSAGLGLLPGALVYAGFKLGLAPHVSAAAGPGILGRLFAFQRYPAVAMGVVRHFGSLGVGWFHPLLPLGVFGAGTGLRKEGREQAWFPTIVAALLLAGYLAVVTGTANELQWQIDTAMGRLLVHWWPLAVIAAMGWFRSAEETGVLEGRGKERRRR